MSLVHVKGLEELKAKFALIGKEAGKKLLRSGVATGARIVKDAAIAAAPVGNSRKGHVAGTLKRAAIIKFLASASTEQQIEYIVTFRMGKRQQKAHRDAFYAAWVEHGHRIIPRTGKAKTLRGILRNRRTIRARRASFTNAFVPPHRFLGPAFERSKERALKAMIERMSRDLDKALG